MIGKITSVSEIIFLLFDSPIYNEADNNDWIVPEVIADFTWFHIFLNGFFQCHDIFLLAFGSSHS